MNLHRSLPKGLNSEWPGTLFQCESSYVDSGQTYVRMTFLFIYSKYFRVSQEVVLVSDQLISTGSCSNLLNNVHYGGVINFDSNEQKHIFKGFTETKFVL